MTIERLYPAAAAALTAGAGAALTAAVVYVLGLLWFTDPRNRRDLAPFFALGLALAAWTAAVSLAIVSDPRYRAVFQTVDAAARRVTPFALLGFALTLTRPPTAGAAAGAPDAAPAAGPPGRGFPGPLRRLLIILPAADLLALLTNPLHHRYVEGGPLHSVHLVLAWGAALAAAAAFARYFVRGFGRGAGRDFRERSSLIAAAVGIVTPYAAGIIDAANARSGGGAKMPDGLVPLLAAAGFLLFFRTPRQTRRLTLVTALMPRIFESYQDAIMLAGMDGRVQAANAALRSAFPSFRVVPGETTVLDFFGHIRPWIIHASPDTFFDCLDRSGGDDADDADDIDGKTFPSGEFTARIGGDENAAARAYRVSSRVFAGPGGAPGCAVTLSDVTEYRSMVEEINRQNRRLQELNREARAASDAKSSFLANTSHEIRTPLNAIIGMTELLLRRGLPPDLAGQINSIKSAGASLLAIINDILDFSKIEAGKLDVTPAPYAVESLLHDVVSIVRTRIAQKPFPLVVNVDAALPARLEGDMARVRQVTLNLLTNAVKFTSEGFVALTVRGLPAGEGFLRLEIAVADTGIGIRAEDLEKLFGEFAQVDTRRNRSIEGTGLGLAISRRLCRLMDGDIVVESVYGKGSVFTASMRQGIVDPRPLARVERAARLRALVWEPRRPLAASLIGALKGLGVKAVAAVDAGDFLRRLDTGAYTHAITGGRDAGAAGERIRARSRAAVFPTALITLRDPGAGAFDGNAGAEGAGASGAFIDLPVYVVPLANALNGVTATAAERPRGARFVAPEARVLVVDDIATNREVVEGLLAQYGMRITSCASGSEAAALAGRERFDLVLMDHMMPGMDGIEAAAAIRARERSAPRTRGAAGGGAAGGPAGGTGGTPIVALTANAMAGAREMFLRKGFSDYLAKPVEARKLDEVVARWIPARLKRPVQAAAPAGGAARAAAAANAVTATRAAGGTAVAASLAAGGTAAASTPSPVSDGVNVDPKILAAAGIDARRGLALTGGTWRGYRRVLETFRGDAEGLLGLLETPEGGGLANVVIQAHALKSAAAAIGAAALAREAAALEAAARAGDAAAVERDLAAFRGRLKVTVERLREGLAGGGAGTGAGAGLQKMPRERLGELKRALERYDMEAVGRLLGELENGDYEEGAREVIARVSDAVLAAEFGEAAGVIGEALGV